MKKTVILIATALSLAFILVGCGATNAAWDKDQNKEQNNSQNDMQGSDPENKPDEEHESKRDALGFAEGQMYAAAYLGYQQIEDWDYYADLCLDSGEVPVHYVSNGDYYLVVPRYDGMKLSVYVNDVVTDEGVLRYEDPSCEPFIIQCNASDVFADVTVRLEYDGETVEFSPFISLENGLPVLGERGLDITKGGLGIPEKPEQAGLDYIGEYSSKEEEGAGLTVTQDSDGHFLVRIDITGLTLISDGVGEITDDGMSFTATDASGDPIRGLITLDGQTATLTFTDSTWEYLPNGTSFQFTKTS